MIINYKRGIIWTNCDMFCSEIYIRIDNFTTYIPIPRTTIYKVDDYINLAKSCIDNYIEYNTDTSAQHLNKDEDIVRAANIHKIAELEDKEPLG